MSGNWIRLYRKAVHSAVFKDADLWRLWCYVLLRAAYRPTKKLSKRSPGKVLMLNPGQLVCGRDELADVMEWTASTTRRRLFALQELGLVEIKSDNAGTIVTICNWQTYQKSSPESGQHLDSKRTVNGQQVDSTGEKSGQQMDTNKKDNNSTKKVEEEDSLSTGADDPDLISLERDFISAWNGSTGCRHNRGDSLTPARRKAFRTRLKSKGWEWQAALAKFPLKCTEQENGWKPDIEWFLRPDSVHAILEGKYDWTPKQTGTPAPKNGSGQVYDPTAAQRNPNHGKW